MILLLFLSDKHKVDRVLHETEKNRRIVNQILNTSFQSQGGDQRQLCVDPEVIIKHFLWHYAEVFQAY